MKWLRNESGQVLAITIFSMFVLLGALGLAVDVGVLFHARRHMQTAADAAAMAGATEMFYNGSGNVATKAYAAAKVNGVDNTVSGNTVIVTISPTLPGAGSCPSCVEVQLATPNPTIFMHTLSNLFFNTNNFATVNVSAMAVGGSPGASQTCMYVMNPSASSALWIHGAGDINAPGCAVYVNSNDPGALCVTGGAGKSTLSRIDVHGGQGSKGNCAQSPGTFPVFTGAGVQSPPELATLPADPTTNCTTVTDLAGSGGTLSGSVNPTGSQSSYYCYKDSATPCTISVDKKGNQTNTCTPVTLSSATLGPGIYVFETGVTITGATTIGVGDGSGHTASGQGATIVVTGNGPYSSGTATTYTDYAPTSGTYNAIAIYQPSTDIADMMLQFGSGSSIFDGAVVAPAANVTLHDQGGAVNATNLIVGQIYVNGTINLTNYSTYNPITSPFKQITLVD